MSAQDPRDRGEREEKLEKHDEKDEKERGEKWRNDPLSAVAWALVLIWAGLVFLAENVLPGVFEELEAWPLIFIGAGGIFLLEALARTLLPEHRRPISGTVVWALVLIAVGFGNLLGWGIIGPLALVAVGIVLVIRTLLGRR